ncbi:MAG TPA: hypothetical protein DCS07_13105 [Bdellovibrionales bacterium]|nr:MAG: hypothetical protein A2Z97_01270 [Bdellovibrionales bacterium GWB1_52_6]OFZ06472.1 MAG: hypothetical protein A2X97_16765 [Bdellovibrionales bacterium GWA1_52_35]OFZ37271.1 MAG: hypothetical protein A2070_08835 [Bdellovibrionales bacterium GWC1_52_8]HAR43545.1 hypothetical protein [Bdellovibrionales bacterium]HCM39475.1 hypothetical protein [Bdellovibrionales bacterium]
MKTKLVLILWSLMFCLPGEAKEMSLTYAGIFAGAGSPSNSDAGITFGGTFGRRMTPDFGTGIYYTQLSSTISALGTAGTSTKLSAYGVEGNYYLTGDMDGMVIGMKLGLLSRTLQMTGMKVTATPLSVGPKLAFDHKLDSKVSVGFEANVLFQGANNGQEAYSLINMLGALKLWF